MNKNTEKKVKRMLVKNFGKNNLRDDVELYVFHLDYFTETLVREMKDFINLDEMFERRFTVSHRNFYTKAFYHELENEKNFGKWIAQDSDLARLEAGGGAARLDTRLVLEFKDAIMNYAKSIGKEEDYQYYINLFESKKEYYTIQSKFNRGEIDYAERISQLKAIGVQFKKIKIGKIEFEQEVR